MLGASFFFFSVFFFFPGGSCGLLHPSLQACPPMCVMLIRCTARAEGADRAVSIFMLDAFLWVRSVYV